jgi:hypothetical protein
MQFSSRYFMQASGLSIQAMSWWLEDRIWMRKGTLVWASMGAPVRKRMVTAIAAAASSWTCVRFMAGPFG